MSQKWFRLGLFVNDKKVLYKRTRMKVCLYSKKHTQRIYRGINKKTQKVS